MVWFTGVLELVFVLCFHDTLPAVSIDKRLFFFSDRLA